MPGACLLWKTGRTAATAMLALVAADAQAATAPGPGQDSGFPPGCFIGQRTDRNIYEVDLGPPGEISVLSPTFRFRYPAACDAGNIERRLYRRRTTLNLHGDVDDGRCYAYEDRVARDPWGVRRFGLFLSAYERLSDLDDLAASRGAKSGKDPYDRWTYRDADGHVAEFVMCRKTGDVASPDCEAHTIFEGARMTLSYKRVNLPARDQIRAFAERMLRCALGRPQR